MVRLRARAASIQAALLVPLLSASPATADCKADLAEVAKRHAAASPVRAETTFMFNGKPRITKVEAAAPDRVRVVQPTTETVIVGNIMWLKQAGRFVRAPRPLQPGEREAVYFDLAEQIAVASDVSCPGAVTAHDGEYAVFLFTSARKIGSWDAVWRTTLYVARHTGLPTRAQVNNDQPTAFVTTFAYDKNIVVTAPE